MSGAILAQRTLTTLLESYPWLGQLVTDFSSEPVPFNADLKIALPSTMDSDVTEFDAEDGFVPSSVTQVEKTLTLSEHWYAAYAFGDQETNATNAGLIERFAANAGHSVAKKIVDTLLALVTAANFTEKTTRGSSTLRYTDMAAAAKKLNDRNVPQSGRWCLLNTQSYLDLQTDSGLAANAGSSSNVVRDGRVGQVAGFDVYAVPGMPTAENLIGCCGGPEALCLATRPPGIPANVQAPGAITLVTEPHSQLSVQSRIWYEMRPAKAYVAMSLMFGCCVGNASSLERIVSA